MTYIVNRNLVGHMISDRAYHSVHIITGYSQEDRIHEWYESQPVWSRILTSIEVCINYNQYAHEVACDELFLFHRFSLVK